MTDKKDGSDYIYAVPGMFEDVGTKDVKSIHDLYIESSIWWKKRNDILSSACDEFAEIVNDRMNKKEAK